MLSSWLGMVLVLVAAGDYVGRLLVRRAPRSTRGYDGFILFGMVVAGAAVTFHHAPAWRFAVAAGVGLVWFVTTRAELRLPGAGAKAPAKLAVGDPLPAFSARTSAGEAFGDKELGARGPAVLVLYRGHWCPYCRTQLGELESEHDRIRAAGLSLFALSTETPEEIARLEERLGGRITFLSDPEGTLLDALGRRHRHGVKWYDRLFLGARQDDIALPTTLVLDRDGRVRFFHRSRKIDDRPSISAILGAILTPP